MNLDSNLRSENDRIDNPDYERYRQLDKVSLLTAVAYTCTTVLLIRNIILNGQNRLFKRSNS